MAADVLAMQGARVSQPSYKSNLPGNIVLFLFNAGYINDFDMLPPILIKMTRLD